MKDNGDSLTFNDLYERRYFMSNAESLAAFRKLPKQSLTFDEELWVKELTGKVTYHVTLERPLVMDSRPLNGMNDWQKLYRMLGSMKIYEDRQRTVRLLNTELQILHAALEDIEPSWSESFLAALMPINKIDRTISYDKRQGEVRSSEEEEATLHQIATLRSLIREKFEAAGKPLKAP